MTYEYKYHCEYYHCCDDDDDGDDDDDNAFSYYGDCVHSFNE